MLHGWFRFTPRVAAVAMLLIGNCLALVSLFSQQWQVSELIELKQRHLYGLWEKCEYGVNAQNVSSKICVFIDFSSKGASQSHSSSSNDMVTSSGALTTSGDNRPLTHSTSRAPTATKWQLWTLILVSLACFMAVFALVFSVCAICLDFLIVFCTVLAMGSGVLMTAAVLVFQANNSSTNNEKTILEIEHVEKKLGLAYWLAIGAAAAFFSGAMLFALTAMMLHRERTEARTISLSGKPPKRSLGNTWM